MASTVSASGNLQIHHLSIRDLICHYSFGDESHIKMGALSTYIIKLFDLSLISAYLVVCISFIIQPSLQVRLSNTYVTLIPENQMMDDTIPIFYDLLEPEWVKTGEFKEVELVENLSNILRGKADDDYIQGLTRLTVCLMRTNFVKFYVGPTELKFEMCRHRVAANSMNRQVTTRPLLFSATLFPIDFRASFSFVNFVSCHQNSGHKMPKKKKTMAEGVVKRPKLTASDSDADQDEEVPLPTLLYRCPICVIEIYSTLKSTAMAAHIYDNHKGRFYLGTSKKLVTSLCKVQDEDEIKMLVESKSKTAFKFPCPEITCNKGFKSYSGLSRHKKTVHSTAFKYCCPCGRLEHDPTRMKTHFKKNHPDETYNENDCKNRMEMVYSEAAANNTEAKQLSYPCNVEGCPKICDFPHQLREHLKFHDKADKTCQYCTKLFLSPFDCRAHVASMHDTSLKKFKCKRNGCQNVYSTERELSQHQNFSRIHNPPKNECDICHTLFQYPKSLTKHKKQGCEPRSKPKYLCQYCGHRYYRKHNLEKHEVRHVNGTLNLKIPSEETIMRYKKLIRQCRDEIYMKKCNNNLVNEESAPTHLILVPCSHKDEKGVKCKKTAVMYSSAPTPFHHIQNLLYSMIRGLACTSLHSHFDGDGHDPDIAGAKFVAAGNSSYEMHMVKKLVVKMAKKEKTVTNLTQFEPYHVYDKSVLEEIATLMSSHKLSSKSHSQLITDMETELKELLNKDGTSTVRGHPPLVFDTMFHFKKTENEEKLPELKEQILDEQDQEDDYEEEDVDIK